MALTVKGVEKLLREAKAGATADGDGLYLKIATEGGAGSWQFRYTIAGKRRMMGLGACSTVTLAEAREHAAEARKLAKQGIDPIEARKVAPEVEGEAPTFRKVATDYIEANKCAWRNTKHAAQWTATLETYAYPLIGHKHPADITTADVLDILAPIWTTKAETASRVRGRIEAVMDAARVRGLFKGENPARWRGHLDAVLPVRTKASKGHHAALPYAEAPTFMQALRQMPGEGARALEFTILTAARSGEVRGATWREIDLDARLWTVPGERMKASKEHRVPLSDAAVALLQGREKGEGGDLVFPGQRRGKPLSDMTLTAALRRMKRPELTAHGFRSTFRDWAAEETHHPHAVAEMALAHTIGNAVEAAYRRGDLLEKRRLLMQDWADYCAGETPKRGGKAGS